MTIKCLGYRGLFNSTERIEQEFIRRGWTLSDKPDLIYHANGFFDDAEAFYDQCITKPIRIYNLLDIPPHIEGWPVEKTKEQLSRAEVVTTISEHVAVQMNEILGINPYVNYFPMRPVKQINIPRDQKYLYVGRVFDSNKRVDLLSGFRGVTVATTQPFHYNKCIFCPSDEKLSELYSSHQFTFLPSKYEGIGLTAVEAVICGSYPVLCNDNPAVKTFDLQPFAADPTTDALLKKVEEIEKNKDYYETIRKSLVDSFISKFSLERVVERIINLYNNTK